MPRIFDNIDRQLLPALRDTRSTSRKKHASLIAVAVGLGKTIPHEDREHGDPQIIGSLGLRRGA